MPENGPRREEEERKDNGRMVDNSNNCSSNFVFWRRLGLGA
jgi:hypothetical protein